MAVALDSPRIPNGNGELWKGRDKSKFNQCECCPYGYHIDLDFVRFCENVSQRNDASLNKERRRERRRQRQSMEVLLGLTSQSFWNIEQQLPPIHQEPAAVAETPNQEEKSSLVRDALHKAVQDFEDTLERTHKAPANHIIDGFPEGIAEPASSGDTSLSSMSAVSSPLTPQDVDTEGGMTADAHEALLQDFDVASIGSATSGHSHAALQNIRQQMALSLERMRDLEEQVKLIPVLQVHLAVAKEEKRKMALLLQEKKLENYKLLSEMEPSQLDDTSTMTSCEISPPTAKDHQRKSRRATRREDTTSRKMRHADDTVPLLKDKPKYGSHDNLLMPGDMWLLSRQIELMAISDKHSDTQFETAVRTQLSTYNMQAQANSPVQHYYNQPSRSPQALQKEIQAKGRKAECTSDVKQPDEIYIPKPKVLYPTIHSIDGGARRKDKTVMHPETPAEHTWDKTEYDGGDPHTRRRSRSVSEVAHPEEPYNAHSHKDSSTLRRDKPRRDVHVQTIIHLVHASTQSDAGDEPKKSTPQHVPTQPDSCNLVPTNVIAYTMKLSVQAFESYLNQCEGSLMRSRSVNKKDQIDIFEGTLQRIMGKEGLVVDSSESSSTESLATPARDKVSVKNVSLKTLDEPRTPLVSEAKPVVQKQVVKFTRDKGTSCAIDLPCKTCLNETPKKTVARGELKNVYVQTKPIEPPKVPVKPLLRDKATITKPDVKNSSAQTAQIIEDGQYISQSTKKDARKLLIDIGIECTIDDFWCTKCQSNLDKVRKRELKSKHVQTKVTLVEEIPAIPKPEEHSTEKESEVSCEHGVDSPSKAPNVCLVDLEEKQGRDLVGSNSENTTDALKPARPISTKQFGMTKYISQSLAEPKNSRKSGKSVFTQTEIRELSPSRNISTNTSKMKMVDRRVGESIPLSKHTCTKCGSSSGSPTTKTKDEKEKRSSSQDRESRIPRPASSPATPSSDPSRRLQRQTTYTKLDVPQVAESDVPTEGLWTPSPDLSAKQGSEIWPSTLYQGEEEARPDVSEERGDGSRQRRSGAVSTTASTSASSLISEDKTAHDLPPEPCRSHSTVYECEPSLSVTSTDTSKKSTYLPGSSEIRKEEMAVLYKAPLPSESDESSMYPHSSEASRFDVTASIELTRTHGPIKPVVKPNVSHRPLELKWLNETSNVTLSTFLERPQRVKNSMALPHPFASPSLASAMGKEPRKPDPESGDVSPAESLMPLPHPFNSPSLFEMMQDVTVKRAVEEHPRPGKGKSGRAKADASIPHQSRGVSQASHSQPLDSKNPLRVYPPASRHVAVQPSANDHVTTGKKTSEGIRRPKPLILPPSDQKETYELIKKGCTSPEHRAVLSTQDSKLPSPAIQGNSACTDAFALQSKEEILSLSASERPKKVDPSTKMKAALKVVNDLIEKSPTLSELGNTAKAANAIIQREWFQISSTPSADPHIVEDYLDHFEEMSSTLLTYVVNMADKAGNTAMHYALSQGNFDVVSILLDSKVCNINLPNAAGYTAVMLVSLAQIRSDTHRCVLQRFLADADVNVRAQQHGQTALMLAVSHNRLDMVQLLIEGGADLNIQDDDGSTALMCAAEHGHAAIVQFLINQPDTDLNIKDVDGLTALDIALDAGHKDVGILLYAHKHFSRNNSPYSSLRGRRSKSATPTTRTASTPPPRTPGSPLPVRPPPRHSHD